MTGKPRVNIRKEEMRRQAYAAYLRGISPDDIARSLGCKKESIYGWVRAEAERTNFSLSTEAKANVLSDRLDMVLAICLQEMSKTKGNSLNKSGLVNAAIRAIEIQSKIQGVYTTKVVGENGGPIKIQAITGEDERKKAIEEIQQRLSQIQILSLKNDIIEHEEVEEEVEEKVESERQ